MAAMIQEPAPRPTGIALERGLAERLDGAAVATLSSMATFDEAGITSLTR